MQPAARRRRSRSPYRCSRGARPGRGRAQRSPTSSRRTKGPGRLLRGTPVPGRGREPGQKAAPLRRLPARGRGPAAPPPHSIPSRSLPPSLPCRGPRREALPHSPGRAAECRRQRPPGPAGRAGGECGGRLMARAGAAGPGRLSRGTPARLCGRRAPSFLSALPPLRAAAIGPAWGREPNKGKHGNLPENERTNEKRGARQGMPSPPGGRGGAGAALPLPCGVDRARFVPLVPPPVASPSYIPRSGETKRSFRMKKVF